MKLWGKSKNGIWRKYKPLLTPSDAKRMGDPVTSATAPLGRKMSRGPMRSLQSTVPRPEKEDAACTINPNQTSSTRPRLVEGIQVRRVSHHPDTVPTAEAPPPASLTAGIPPHILPGSDQWPNPRGRQKQHWPSHWHRKLQNWSPQCRGHPLWRTTTTPHIIPSTKTPRNSSNTLWEIWIGKPTTWKSDAWPPSTHKPQSLLAMWLPPPSPPW